MADWGEVVLRQRVCRGCHAVFWICRHCDRGQQYCRTQCRARARREQRRRANRRHQQSPYGREDHRDSQREYRKRCAQTRVTDPSSAAVSSPNNMPGWDTRSTRNAAQAPSTAAASVLSLALAAWRKHSEEHVAPFLCCVLCGRRGRFVDPFPTIPRFRRPG
jgi:hypothetical protein